MRVNKASDRIVYLNVEPLNLNFEPLNLNFEPLNLKVEPLNLNGSIPILSQYPRRVSLYGRSLPSQA
ncbi:MAG: hypothetical protein KME38_14000 [Spirirestis rafaelensis WJT71-NPBG6]|nr:hypothetical protein [Spirirestis rafaelensis WJT71-NPBG6]